MNADFSKKYTVTLLVLVWLLLVSACAIQKPDETTKAPAATPAVEPPAPPARPSPVPEARQRENFFIKTTGGQIALATPVKKIALNIEAQKLGYNTEPLTDCSGIFHRFMKAVKKEYPEYEYPLETDRTTRALARWYHERGELKLIKDVFAQDSVIRPGAVLFYGYRNVQYTNFAPEDLFVRGSGINHMGVVVDVVRDDAGNVDRYTLFHGHGRKGNPASITTWHKREPTRANYPPLGNADEQWIAFARLLPNAP